MSTQVTITLNDGRVISGISYRMTSGTARALVPASPGPFAGGVYQVETASGWLDIQASRIRTIVLKPGRPT